MSCSRKYIETMWRACSPEEGYVEQRGALAAPLYFCIFVAYYGIMKKLSTPIIDVKRYGGKQVAIVKGKIVASGIDTGEVLERAKRKFPGMTWQDILLVNVPQGLTVVYRV